MARELNNEFLQPLAPILPAARLGRMGDAPKVYCATCHQGVSKPLYGANMVQYFPELIAPKVQAAASAPSPAASAAPAAPLGVVASLRP
jgi:photosynthetic reaction center cytochrome c subunit